MMMWPSPFMYNLILTTESLAASWDTVERVSVETNRVLVKHNLMQRGAPLRHGIRPWFSTKDILRLLNEGVACAC